MPDPVYRSTRRLVKWMTVLLIAEAVLCLAGLWSRWNQIARIDTAETRFEEVMAGLEEELARLDEELGGAETQSSWVDAYVVPVSLIDLAQAGVALALFILFCNWIPCANRNARALGATGMRFTPRWCVIWYVIPIMHLFRPYEAMKEIWRASTPADGTQWRQHRVPLILPLWWALWLASLLAYCVAHGWPWEGYDDSWRATGATIFADAIDVPLAIVAMLLVRNIHAMQEHGRTTTVFD